MPLTKAVNLTEEEIEYLIANHGGKLYSESERAERLERINYLHKRLKAFDETEVKPEIKSNDGWGNAPIPSTAEGT